MDGEVIIGTSLDTTKFDKQIQNVERRINEIEKELSANKELGFLSDREVADLNIELEKAKNKLISLNKQKAKLSEDTGIGTELNTVNSALSKVTGKVAKWALAVFGVRSAYMAVRQATSTLSQYNDELANKLEGIRLFFASALEPAVNSLVNLVYKLMVYINYIAQAWFGVNLFARATELSMKKSVGSAQKLRKSLAGFDEMNILGDNTVSAGGGGTSFPEPTEAEIPSWMKWIVDHKQEILSVLTGIAVALGLIYLGVELLQATGIGIAIAGIVYSISSLLEYLEDPSWENFGKIIQGIGIAILGVAIAIGSVPVAVAGAIVLIIGTIIKYWEKIKTVFQNGIDWLSNKSDFVHEMFGDLIGNVYDNFVNNLQSILIFFDTVFKDIKQILDGIIQFVKGVFTGDWEMAWEGVKKIFLGIAEIIYITLYTVLDGLKQKAIQIGTNIGNTVYGAFKAVVNAILSAIENLLNGPINAINSLIWTINQIPGINLSRLSTFKFPRLKVGGIINQPGRGILTGGAIAGESGREGVIPLTDTQAMEILGETIGKYITINANITNTMNGRVISRQLQQIQNDRSFVYNS